MLSASLWGVSHFLIASEVSQFLCRCIVLWHGVAQVWQIRMKRDTSGTNLLKYKQKQKEIIGPLLNRRDELVTNTEKAEFLYTFYTSLLISIFGSQALWTKIQVDENTDPLSVKDKLVCEQLQEFDPYKFMCPDNIHS